MNDHHLHLYKRLLGNLGYFEGSNFIMRICLQLETTEYHELRVYKLSRFTVQEVLNLCCIWSMTTTNLILPDVIGCSCSLCHTCLVRIIQLCCHFTALLENCSRSKNKMRSNDLKPALLADAILSGYRAETDLASRVHDL